MADNLMVVSTVNANNGNYSKFKYYVCFRNLTATLQFNHDSQFNLKIQF